MRMEDFSSTFFNYVNLRLQDDSYLESYISTIGVDFVSVCFILCPTTALELAMESYFLP